MKLRDFFLGLRSMLGWYDENMIKVAMLWLINEYGELLLARRADDKATDPGLWGPSVTGRLEDGETYVQAVARETEEELGLSATEYAPDFLFETEFAHPDGNTRQFQIYAARIPKETKLTVDKHEVAETEWMTMEKVKQLLTGEPGDKVVASAFTPWEQIFKTLEERNAIRASGLFN